MTTPNTNPLVWVKDDADNMFLCQLDQLRDPNTVSEEEKANCLHDASALATREDVPGKKKINFPKSASPS